MFTRIPSTGRLLISLIVLLCITFLLHVIGSGSKDTSWGSQIQLMHRKLLKINASPPSLPDLDRDPQNPQRRHSYAAITEGFGNFSALGSDFLRYALQPPKSFAPFPNVYNVPIMDDASKVVFCWIPKVACTQFKAFFCLKETPQNQTGIRELLRTFEPNTVHHGKHCKSILQQYLKVPSAIRSARLGPNSTWTKYAIVRDPLDRLISGWVDKCGSRAAPNVRAFRCYGCSQDFACFIQRNAAFLTALSHSNQFKTNGTVMKADHFFPQYWYCDFSHHLPDFDRVLRLEKTDAFKKRVRSDFVKLGMPEDVVSAGWGKEGKTAFLDPVSRNSSIISSAAIANPAKTTEKPSDTPYSERDHVYSLLQSNLTLTESFFRTYFVDYIAFGFQLPPWISALCHQLRQRTAKDGGASAHEYLVCRWVHRL